MCICLFVCLCHFRPCAITFSTLHLSVCFLCRRERGGRFSTNAPAAVIWWLFTTSAANWEPNCFWSWLRWLLNLIWGWGNRAGGLQAENVRVCLFLCLSVRACARACVEFVLSSIFSCLYRWVSRSGPLKCPSGAESGGSIWKGHILAQRSIYCITTSPPALCHTCFPEGNYTPVRMGAAANLSCLIGTQGQHETNKREQ